ncbi:MAG: bifunctional precorrin-2 dehydrogenase/sirohydrochlorin ferrochelatase [Myxococcales bacterium]|nr:bifunctional precorrin-2 dehydrogenase/sirohydrochlorin ferrochelatase [Myxococcales bacterium]
MNLYPVLLDLRGAPCLVVGGGAVATRKVRGLLAAGAAPTVIAPEISPELAEHKEGGRIDHVSSSFEDALLEAFQLVFVATSDPKVNADVARLAREAGVWVNVADDPDGSSFQVPAHFRRGELTVAISTGGASPAEARRVREEIEHYFPSSYGDYLELLRKIRARLLDRDGPGSAGNAERFTGLVRSGLRERFLAGDTAGSDAILREILGPGYSIETLRGGGES